MKVYILSFFFLCFSLIQAQGTFPMQNKSYNDFSSAYGSRDKGPGSTYDYDWHAGLDIAGSGNNVLAVFGGKATTMGGSGYNKYLIIEHQDTYGKFATMYMHIDIDDQIVAAINMGQSLNILEGDVIGVTDDYYPTGSTSGDHLDIRYFYDVDNASYADLVTYRNAGHPYELFDISHFQESNIKVMKNENTELSSGMQLEIQNASSENPYFEFIVLTEDDELDIDRIYVELSAYGNNAEVYDNDDLLVSPGTENATKILSNDVVSFFHLINCGDYNYVADSDEGHNSNTVGIYPIDFESSSSYHKIYFKWYINKTIWETLETDAMIDCLEFSDITYEDYSIKPYLYNIRIKNPYLDNYSEGSVVFDPLPGVYDEEVHLNLTGKVNGTIIYFNKELSYSSPPACIDIGPNQTQDYIIPPSTTSSSLNLHYGTWYRIKAACVSKDYTTFHEQTMGLYYIRPNPTGINDFLWLYLNTTPYSMNHPYFPLNYGFDDVDKSGTTIGTLDNFKLELFHKCGSIIIDLGSTTLNINSSSIPTNYQWERDGNGNVKGTLIIGCTDSDGHHHTAEDDILIRNVPYNTITSGAICGDHTWSGNVTVTGDIFVFEDASLTISAGANITFTNNSKLEVLGSLVINGTSNNYASLNFSTPNTNNGIKIYSIGTADIDYAEISNAYVGINVNGGELNLNNAKINNNYMYGIRLRDAAYSEITNSYIENNNYFGIYLDGSSPLIQNNMIRNNSSTGLIAVDGSQPTVLKNTIIGNSGYGVVANDNSSIAMFGGNGGKNKIISNSLDGIKLLNSGSIYSGPISSMGENSIYSNTDYDLSAYSNSTATMLYNYWGTSTPSASQFYNDGTAYLSRSSHLTSDHGSGSSLSKASKDELVEAYDLYANKQYDEASELFKKIISKNIGKDKSIFALDGLRRCSKKMRSSGFEEYLNNTFAATNSGKNDKYKNHYLLVKSGLLEEKGEYEASKEILNSLLSNYDNDIEKKKYLLFKKAKLDVQKLGDITEAKDILAQMYKLDPKDESIVILEAEINLFSGEEFKGRNFVKESNTLQSNDSDASTFELVQNHPNPFNPTTTISYQIPEQGFVTLKVYDMLGREVANLVNNKMEAGKYSVNFNANNLASGIYVYRITVQSFEGSRNFLTQSNKMLLLK